MASNLRFTTPAVSGSGQLRTAQSSSYLKPTALQNTYALPGEFIRLDTGEVISRNEYNSLTPEQQSLLQSQGISKFNEAEQAKVTEAMSHLVKLDSGEYVSKEDYAKLTPEQQTALQKWGRLDSMSSSRLLIMILLLIIYSLAVENGFPRQIMIVCPARINLI